MYIPEPIFKGDLFTALEMLSEGDSATIKINMDSMVAKLGRPKPANTTSKYWIYTVKVNKVIHKGKLSDSLFRVKVNEFLEVEMDQFRDQEVSKILSYIAFKNLKPLVTTSGLNYVITKEGKGKKPYLAIP